MAKEAHDARAAFRLPADVLVEWKAKAVAAGFRNLSDFLRSAVDAQRITRIATADKRKRKIPKLSASDRCDPKLLNQLAAIGNNINQIAKALQSCRKIGATVEVAEVFLVLVGIEQQVRQFFPQLPLPAGETRSPEKLELMREKAARARQSRGKKNAS